MLILITGASGRIGSVAVTKLAQLGHRVRGFVMDNDPLRSRLDELDVEVVTGDLATGEGLEEAVAGVEAIIHLGALMAWTLDDHRSLFDINVQGTYNLLQTVLEQGVVLHRFVLASTDASYPASASLYSPVDEHHPQVPNLFYGMTKQATEIIAEYYRRSHDIPVTRVRFCYTLSPDEVIDPTNPHAGRTFYLNPRIARMQSNPNLSAKERKTLELLKKVRPADGSERIFIPYGENGESYIFTLCHVDDLVDGIKLVLEQDAAVGDVYNLGPSGPFAMDVAMKYMSEKTGVPYVELRLPGEAIVYSVDTSKARSVLGFSPKHDIFSILDEATENV